MVLQVLCACPHLRYGCTNRSEFIVVLLLGKGQTTKNLEHQILNGQLHLNYTCIQFTDVQLKVCATYVAVRVYSS